MLSSKGVSSIVGLGNAIRTLYNRSNAKGNNWFLLEALILTLRSFSHSRGNQLLSGLCPEIGMAEQLHWCYFSKSCLKISLSVKALV